MKKIILVYGGWLNAPSPYNEIQEVLDAKAIPEHSLNRLEDIQLDDSAYAAA